MARPSNFLQCHEILPPEITTYDVLCSIAGKYRNEHPSDPSMQNFIIYLLLLFEGGGHFEATWKEVYAEWVRCRGKILNGKHTHNMSSDADSGLAHEFGFSHEDTL